MANRVPPIQYGVLPGTVLQYTNISIYCCSPTCDMDHMCKIMLKAFIQGSHTMDRTKFLDISLIKFLSDVKGILFYQVNIKTTFRPNHSEVHSISQIKTYKL